MIIETCNTIRVWFCYESKLWAVTWEDAEGNQLDESEWYHSKSEAVDTAKAYRDSNRCKKLEISKRAA